MICRKGRSRFWRHSSYAGGARGAAGGTRKPAAGNRGVPIQRLCRITVPGLTIKRDFSAARARLLAGFPDIEEVIATTAPGTLLVLSHGPEDVDAWLRELLDLRAADPRGARGILLRWPTSRGGDSAA